MKNVSPLVAEFAPAGRLRVSINLGNPILANSDPASGRPYGVSVDLAREFADRLGVDVEYEVFDAAGKCVDAMNGGGIDLGFFAIDPVRGKEINFTSPYVVIEGAYLVPANSSIRNNSQVDREGHRVAVGTGSAYDLFLTRELKHAEIVRVPTSPDVVDAFVKQGLEVAAGVKQQLEADARRIPGLRLLDGRFMVINQAMGIPKSRSADAYSFLCDFVEEIKAKGVVASVLERHRIHGACVAPPRSHASSFGTS